MEKSEPSVKLFLKKTLCSLVAIYRVVKFKIQTYIFILSKRKFLFTLNLKNKIIISKYLIIIFHFLVRYISQSVANNLFWNKPNCFQKSKKNTFFYMLKCTDPDYNKIQFKKMMCLNSFRNHWSNQMHLLFKL